jgi:hypothetical protein
MTPEGFAITLAVLIALVAGFLVGRLTATQRKTYIADVGTGTGTAGQLHGWRELYRKEFGITIGDIAVPEQKPGFNRLIVVAKGLTVQQVFAVLGNHFATWSYYDLGTEVLTDERTNTETHAIWARERQEADEELANKSANTIAEMGINTMTLLERLLYELVFYAETGNHLDVQNVTLCTGSRNSDGDVPLVDWDADNGKLYVLGCLPGGSHPDLRARAVS